MPASKKSNTLSKHQLHQIFLRHRGSVAQLAKEMMLSRSTVSKWFLGKVTSGRVEEAVRERAAELTRPRPAGAN